MKAMICFFTAVLTLAFFTSFVFAESNEEEYIVILSDRMKTISLMALNEEVEPVSDVLNIYKTDRETAELMLECGMAESIEINSPIELADAGGSYNDSEFDKQWYFNSVNAGFAKKRLGSGKGVRVAVIDSGVIVHPDFNSANIEKGYNYVNPQYDGNYVSDSNPLYKSHGTMVAGIICSQENNGQGIVGIAPDATIVPLVVYQDGKGDVLKTVKALEEAVSVYKCDVVNMSLTSSNSSALKRAADYAYDNGVIITAAVGNKSNNIKYYPAGFENVIGVGSVNKSFGVSDFSQKNDSVGIVAPGEEIYLANSAGEYEEQGGTSFASPIAAGFAVLMKEKYPDINHDSFLECLKAGSLDMGDSGYDVKYGFGVLDMKESIEAFESADDFFVSPVYNNEGVFNLKLYSDSLYNGLLIFSVYNGGKLENCFYRNFETADNIYCDTVRYTPKTGDVVKIFVLDSFEKIMPLGRFRKMLY